MNQGHEIREGGAWISKVLQGRATYGDLPMLYTGGFAAMTVLNELKRRTGSFYRSRIPDVYSAFAIASLIPHYAYSHAPFAIGGISRHSIGVDQFAKGKKAEGSPSLKFTQEENVPFHRDVPLTALGGLPPSLQAVVFESYLQTADLREGGQSEPFDRQLEVILASAPSGDAQLAEWALSFAGMHGLDFERISARSGAYRRKLRLAAIPANFARRFSRRNLGSQTQLLTNVYDASLAAAAVLGGGKRW
jgi:hypothetical protein